MMAARASSSVESLNRPLSVAYGAESELGDEMGDVMSYDGGGGESTESEEPAVHSSPEMELDYPPAETNVTVRKGSSDGYYPPLTWRMPWDGRQNTQVIRNMEWYPDRGFL